MIEQTRAIFEQELFASLAAGASCLTVNNRLARETERRYDQWRLSEGDHVWQTPAILSLSDWLERSWQRQSMLYTSNREQLLSIHAERLVWRDIIVQREADSPLMRVGQTAEMAREAYQLCHAYRLTQAELMSTRSAETAAFLGWRRDFDRLCAARRWVSRSQLADRLDTDLLPTGTLYFLDRKSVV